jgi:hypothetical protein
VNADSPGDAQAIVAAYLSVVEAQAAAETYPGSLRDLPHSKETIRAAFKTVVAAMLPTGQLSPELREYLEVAYVSLADYLDDETGALLREYARAGEELASGSRIAHEKVASDAWRRVSEQSALAGQLARAISDEGEKLRAEFRAWQAS